ncbi:MAG: type II toxin-antitoxin system RelE/ParE family toxin, partial [Dethiobacteria bacterium]
LNIAEAELQETIDYYNRQSEGLGFEFALEVKDTISRIALYLQAWTPLSNRTRRCRTKRFPYALVYQVRKDFVLIVAVMHLRKDPEYWKTRVSRL